MLQGLVEGLTDVSMSLMKLSSRLDFFLYAYPWTLVCVCMPIIHFRVNLLICLVGDNDLAILLSILLDNIYV